MTFDDQLKRAFDTLSDRLRDELDRQVRAVMDELSASAHREADAAAAAAVAAIPPPPPPPEPVIERVIEYVPQVDLSAAQRLVEGVRAIDAARSLTDVLDSLIAAAAHDDIGAGIWVVRGGHSRYWRSTGIAAPPGDHRLDDDQHHRAIAEAARTNMPSAHEGFAVPLAISGQVVAVLWTCAAADSSAELPAARTDAIEILARHAARCLESLTAFKTARAMADRAAAAARDSAGGAAPISPPASGDASIGEDDVAAQRYARLLVSEIKLYHEQAVVEGRRDRDLATRLGGEIARARVMYEQRVPPHVRERADHFHDELVRTLADGDASLLELRT